MTQILDSMDALIKDYEKDGPALQQDVRPFAPLSNATPAAYWTGVGCRSEFSSSGRATVAGGEAHRGGAAVPGPAREQGAGTERPSLPSFSSFLHNPSLPWHGIPRTAPHSKQRTPRPPAPALQLDTLRKRYAWARVAAAEAQLAGVERRTGDLSGFLQKWEEGLRDYAEIEARGKEQEREVQAAVEAVMLESEPLKRRAERGACLAWALGLSRPFPLLLSFSLVLPAFPRVPPALPAPFRALALLRDASASVLSARGLHAHVFLTPLQRKTLATQRNATQRAGRLRRRSAPSPAPRRPTAPRGRSWAKPRTTRTGARRRPTARGRARRRRRGSSPRTTSSS